MIDDLDFREEICPICGNKFSIFEKELWVYKYGGYYLCRWHCFLEAERRGLEKKPKKRKNLKPRDAEIVAKRKSGISANELAKEYKLTPSRIREIVLLAKGR